MAQKVKYHGIGKISKELNSKMLRGEKHPCQGLRTWKNNE